MIALRQRWRLACLAVVCFLTACATVPPLVTAVPVAVATPDTPPPAPREFRAVWVATVSNIDWPSRAGLDAAQQQAEMRRILDSAQRLQLNAIVLQVRPAADAIYPSALEPWSEVLSGTQGQPPQPYYDPLQTWIAEAHQRGLQLHAWINPYRARTAGAKSPSAPLHIANRQPELVRSYGEQLWMDPAEPAAAQRTLDVVADLARRYDLDGIHIDDYFYPYPVADGQGGELDFPDDAAWQRYLGGGGPLSRADWRRDQVNRLVQRMHTLVHSDKPWLRFGISPFGIGKPQRRAPGIQGFSQYDKLYADVELWLAQGWLDYLAPQLYWPIDQSAQAFGVLLDSWRRDNPLQRPIWPGLFTSRIDGSAKGWNAEEIVRQVALTRQAPATLGHLHFSMVALLQNRGGVADQLQTQSYTDAALVPAAPWLGHDALSAPQVLRWQRETTGLQVLLEPDDGKGQMLAIWARYGGQWRFFTQPVQSTQLNLAAHPTLGLPDRLVLSRVGRYGQESPRTAVAF